MSYWALLRTIPEGSRQIQIQCWNSIILIQYNFIVTETPLWVEDTATPPVTPLFLCPFRLSSRLHKAQRLWYYFPLKVWIVPLCLRMNWPIHHGGRRSGTAHLRGQDARSRGMLDHVPHCPRSSGMCSRWASPYYLMATYQYVPQKKPFLPRKAHWTFSKSALAIYALIISSTLCICWIIQ